MNKQEKIAVIYKEIANKELSFNGVTVYTRNNQHYPVMIGDILNWIEKNFEEISDGVYPGFGELNRQWKEKRKPIEEQSEECIDYITNLTNKC